MLTPIRPVAAASGSFVPRSHGVRNALLVVLALNVFSAALKIWGRCAHWRVDGARRRA